MPEIFSSQSSPKWPFSIAPVNLCKPMQKEVNKTRLIRSADPPIRPLIPGWVFGRCSCPLGVLVRCSGKKPARSKKLNFYQQQRICKYEPVPKYLQSVGNILPQRARDSTLISLSFSRETRKYSEKAWLTNSTM